MFQEGSVAAAGKLPAVGRVGSLCPNSQYYLFDNLRVYTDLNT